MPETDIKDIVRERYAEAARNVRAPGSCCGGAACGADAALAGVSAITSNLYAADETGALPEEAVLASLAACRTRGASDR
jgi:arsenite methyltransferase